MRPKKINKEEKRKEIALSCLDLLYDKGLKNITVAQVAQTAGIGKGTVYEYFEHKEDIVFEIINMHIQKYHEAYLEEVKHLNTVKEKLTLFFKFILDESEENQKDFNIYKEYLAVLLAEANDPMMDFNDKCRLFFKEQLEIIIEESIEKNEINPIARNLVNSLLVFEKGLALMKMTNKNYDAKAQFEEFLENFMVLIKV